MKISLQSWLVFSLLAILLPASLLAQGSVTIFGSVTDESGAVVPGAMVTVNNLLTGLSREATTNESGDYVVSQLPVGVYAVAVESAGFKTAIQEDIQVQVDENRRVDFSLTIGAVTESITVQAAVAQVETREGAIKEVVDERRIVELPLNGRNAIELQYLVAGVGRRASAGQAQNPSVSINGSRTNSNNYTLDGGDNHDPYFNTPAAFPNPDALKEFSIQTNSYSAERGRNAGAIMNAITKSGTNEFHGTAFEFLRNEELNARNFFANDVPPFKRNQFGGTFGGPVVRDKLFFFGSYQGTRERSAPGAQTAVVPTAPMRTGDFSEFGTTISDPTTGDPFPGNVIPSSRLSQPAVDYQEAFIPLPNRGENLFTFPSGQSIDDDQLIGKVDYNISDSNRMYGRLLYTANDTAQAVSNVPGFLASIEYRQWSIVANDTHVFSPSLLNSLTFTFADIDRVQNSITPGDRTWMDFGAGFTRTMTADAPAAHDTRLDGYWRAFTRFPLNHFRKNIQVSNTMSWNKGAHYVRFGGEVRRSLLDLQEFFRGDPFVRFRGTFTGDAQGDFLLGKPFQFAQIAEDSNLPRTWEIALFAQDDWKVSPRLTLNLGVRWEPYLPFIDKTNKFSQIHLGQQSTIFPTSPEGVLYAGDPGVPRALVEDRFGNIAPRFGFAFDPFGDGKMSVRGGYGVFYSQIRQQAHNQISTNQPFSLKLTVDRPSGGLENPYADTGNPFPFSPPQTPEEIQNYNWVTPMEVTQWNVDMRNAIIQQWNFNIQRQFAQSYVFTAAYVGSKGNHLFMSNEMNPAIFGLEGNTNQRRLLHPTFSRITDQSARGNSVYHAMQLTLNKRMANNLTVLANYTWAKLIDDASSDGARPANPFNIAAERGLSDFHLPHRFVVSYIWNLPRLTSQPAVIRHVLGGWSNNGIITVEAGRYLTVTSGRDNSRSGVNRDRANVVGDWEITGDRSKDAKLDEWFNTAAFEVNDIGTFGNAGRNIVQGPGNWGVTFGLFKDIPVTERYMLQFRSEFFNLFNNVNLGNPNTNVSAGNFGRITSAGSPRVIQFALKFVF